LAGPRVCAHLGTGLFERWLPQNQQETDEKSFAGAVRLRADFEQRRRVRTGPATTTRVPTPRAVMAQLDLLGIVADMEPQPIVCTDQTFPASGCPNGVRCARTPPCPGLPAVDLDRAHRRVSNDVWVLYPSVRRLGTRPAAAEKPVACAIFVLCFGVAGEGCAHWQWCY
jgi:hypothetical protein